MNKQRNHSQLKEQENSPEKTNNQKDLSSLLDLEFKKEVIKILKEIRKAINRNAGHSKKELETKKRDQTKLENSIAEMDTKMKAIYNKLNNAEEW